MSLHDLVRTVESSVYLKVLDVLIMVCRTVEALARAGEYDKPLFRKAVAMFEVCVDSM